MNRERVQAGVLDTAGSGEAARREILSRLSPLFIRYRMTPSAQVGDMWFNALSRAGLSPDDVSMAVETYIEDPEFSRYPPRVPGDLLRVITVRRERVARQIWFRLRGLASRYGVARGREIFSGLPEVVAEVVRLCGGWEAVCHGGARCETDFINMMARRIR